MRGPKKSFTNGEITVFWNPEKCINAFYCVNDLPQVFDTTKEPWIDLKNAPLKQIIEAVDSCPALAISWEWNKNII